VDCGAHLPLIDFDGVPALRGLKAYAAAARSLGFRCLAANDHLKFGLPWLDGPSALTAVVEESGDMTLATSVALPVIRGPAALAKTAAAIDRLSDGRLALGMGPGSSAADYALAGVPFDQRWPRFEEALRAMRAMLTDGSSPFHGEFYTTADVRLEPPPAQAHVPFWVGSWGSAAGLRRVARHGDGWLASAYNTTPEEFGAGFDRLRRHLGARGRDAERFPAVVGTAWMYVTEDRGRADAVLREVLSPLLGRPIEQLDTLSLPVGPAEVCAERLAAFGAAGAEMVIVWPVGDALRQLQAFGELVLPALASA
jgi:alkanesulfonate monooxygenase SsuD/methylene tetrahydromethanopterin reductase-like flavin-dependent oxidoreductase (luciferase family)